MSSKKDILKSYIKFSPRERKVELEAFIDNEISDNDVNSAIDYVQKLNDNNHSHSITEMGYSDAGDFYVKTETGMTFIK